MLVGSSGTTVLLAAFGSGVGGAGEDAAGEGGPGVRVQHLGQKYGNAQFTGDSFIQRN